MNIFLWLLGGVVLISAYFVVLSVLSRRAPELGLVAGQLRPCPNTPNCISSEDIGARTTFTPLTVIPPPDRYWARARETVRAMGGIIDRDDGTYLHATFVTPLFRFVDDLELRLDTANHRLHLRSASRVGRSDLGANRKRLETFRAAMTQSQSTP